MRIVIPGCVGPSTCDDGLGVVNRTPGRFPMPFGKTNLKPEFALVAFDDDFSFDSEFSFDAESSGVAFGLKPGGNKLLMSTLNETLFSTLSIPPEPESCSASGVSVVVVVDFGSLKPGGKNLLMSSMVVFNCGRFVVILSFGSLKPGGKNLLISSVNVLKRIGAFVANVVDGL